MFYDPNHPTNFFLGYIASELLKMLIDNNVVDGHCLKIDNCLDSIEMPVNDNVKVYQKIIQKYTTSTECCKGTKSLLYITYC